MCQGFRVNNNNYCFDETVSVIVCNALATKVPIVTIVYGVISSVNFWTRSWPWTAVFI